MRSRRFRIQHQSPLPYTSGTSNKHKRLQFQIHECTKIGRAKKNITGVEKEPSCPAENSNGRDDGARETDGDSAVEGTIETDGVIVIDGSINTVGSLLTDGEELGVLDGTMDNDGEENGRADADGSNEGVDDGTTDVDGVEG
mmetsp:Transcript_12932/g.30098  ORF Transcript_12932/g.30098 Transcript_12932/m.30098 type:complete len:142 (+) Transcript_12932:538-963(+)